jgi:hypothetical protein
MTRTPALFPSLRNYRVTHTINEHSGRFGWQVTLMNGHAGNARVRWG